MPPTTVPGTVEQDTLLVFTVIGTFAITLAFCFLSYKLFKHIKKSRQPQDISTTEDCTTSTAIPQSPLQVPSRTLDWATVIDDTVGAHPNAQPYHQRVYPPGYLNYIHLPVSFPSLPSTARVVGLYAQRKSKPTR